MRSTAKAWVAATVAFLSALLGEWVGGDDPLQPRDLVVAALAFAVALGAVYTVSNQPPTE